MNTAECLRTESFATLHRVARAWERTGVPARLGWCAAAAASVAIATGAGAPPLLTATVGVLLGTAALVDVAEHRLPNQLLLGAAVTAILAAVIRGDAAPAVIGAVVAGGLLLAVRLVRGLGMGDVKMAAVIGAAVAPRALVAAPVAIAVAALAAGVTGLVSGRARRALGPALWLGWAVALVVPMGWFL